MRALITGINGFVGGHLSSLLLSQNAEVFGTDIALDAVRPGVHTGYMNLLDKEQAIKTLENIRPDCIYHLAGQANVGLSWKNPYLTVNVNVMGTVNLLEAVAHTVPEAKVLVIGSGDQYGAVKPEMCPLREDAPLNPQSPYAVSKAMQETAAGIYIRSFGLKIILVRAFNHTGPGQNTGFVVPDFACGIARIENGLQDSLSIGNLEAMRDFSDVRDIVRGYCLLMEKGRPGEVYNIGSGVPRKISEILDKLVAKSKARIKIQEDPERMRPSDAPLIYADCAKLLADTGYKPQISLDDTLQDVLDFWRSRIAALNK